MDFIIPLIVSFGIVFGLVPLIKKAALRYGFVDKPSGRKIHAKPIPLMGGIAIYIATIVTMLIFIGVNKQTLTIIVGGTALVLIGLLDDGFKAKGIEFPVWPRLIVYIIVSSVPLWFGIEIIGITNPTNLNMFFFPTWLVWLATMAWVFGLTNMVNFIDGVDGLASGIVTISSLTLLIVSVLRNQTEPGIMASILAGAALAFLVYNFYPAKIFMGDAGAVFLGYSLAVIAVDGAFKSATFISVLVPVLALGVPIMDTVIVFSRRFLQGKGLHTADKLHTHHSLMQWGLTQTQTVSFLYLVGALFSLLSIILMLTVS